MNKLFYIIFNSYYKHGEYKNDNPALTVGGIFTVFFFSIALSALMISNLSNYPINPLIPNFSKPIIILICTFFGAIVYLLFFYNNRHLKIYEKYKEAIFLNSKLAKRLGFFIIFFIILFPLLIGILCVRIYLGHWIKIV